MKKSDATSTALFFITGPAFFVKWGTRRNDSKGGGPKFSFDLPTTKNGGRGIV